MKAGVGFSNSMDFFSSGKEIAEKALKNGNIMRPDFVFSFCGGNVDCDAIFHGIQSVVGDTVNIVGGSAIGVLTHDHLSYENYPAGCAVLQSDSLQCNVSVASDINKNEKLAGNNLVKKMSLEADEESPLILFYDSIKKTPTEKTPPVMNASSPLIEGIEEEYKSDIPIVGAGLIGDYSFNPVNLFCGSYVSSQSVVGSILKGNFKTYYKIMHGLTPLNGVYHTITGIEGSTIYEVDGKPIVKMIDDLYGSKEWQNQNPVQLVSLGVNYGEKYVKPEESNYVNRLITGVLPEGKGVCLFEPDLHMGAEIQFMLRDTGEMIRSTKNNSLELMNQIESDGRKAVWGLYIDCAGRTANVSNTSTEEASEVQKVFNQNGIPLLGFYSGVEIAPFLGKSRGLDWTGVLVVMAEGQKDA
ncbi:FIST signal transduction protein [Candidatus Latescibacterota bacterium]